MKREDIIFLREIRSEEASTVAKALEQQQKTYNLQWQHWIDEYIKIWQLLFEGEGEIKAYEIAALNSNNYELVGKGLQSLADLDFNILLFVFRSRFSHILAKNGLSMRIEDNDQQALEQALQSASLEALDMHQNKTLTKLPDEIGALKSLRILDISQNENLTELPPEIVKLQHLEALLFDDQNFDELPAWLGELKNLKYLSLKNENRASLPHWLPKLKRLQHLEIWYHINLTKLPRFIGKFSELEVLDLEDMSIKKLPRQIGRLRNLKKLNIGYTHIRRLPNSLTKLKNLEVLQLIETKVDKLPRQIGRLRKLKKLEVIGGYIDKLPKSFAQLTNLEYLMLSDVYECPRGLAEFKKLRYLCLQLRDFPSNLLQLINLEELRLRFLTFDQIPPEIQRLTKLKKISFMTNKDRWTQENYDTFKNWLPPNCDIDVQYKGSNFRHQRLGVAFGDE